MVSDSRYRAQGGPQLLVSMCNRGSEDQPSGLLRLDLHLQHSQWIDVGFPVASGAGICATGDRVFHVSIASADLATTLSILSRGSLDVLAVHRLAGADDRHSIVVLGDELLVASTGTDEVLAYRMQGDEVVDVRQAWSPTGLGVDTHHINSLAVVEDEVLCTAFGPKEGQSWSSATHGYIRNLTRDQEIATGLRQPHTITSHGGVLYFCNSALGTVNSLDDEIAFVSGYSRGLAFAADGTLYAGTSVGRRPMGEVVPAGTPPDMLGRSAVVQISPSGMRTEVSMSRWGSEIYDLLLL